MTSQKGSVSWQVTYKNTSQQHTLLQQLDQSINEDVAGLINHIIGGGIYLQ